MLYLFLSFLVLLGSMFFLVYTDFVATRPEFSSSLVLGFILLASFCVGKFVEKIHLPKMIGYILSGLFFGPYFLKFVDSNTLTDLSFVNSLAITFIAFCAGGELRASHFLDQLKSILYLAFTQSIVVFIGISFVVFFLTGYIPVFSGAELNIRIAISIIFGVISVACSPSSAIAIISETKAKGTYTDIVLSVTIVKDVAIIILFGIAISFSQYLINTEGTLSGVFFLFLLLELFIAVILGYFLGICIIFLIEHLHLEFPIIVIAAGFLVIKISHMLGDYLHEAQNIAINLEPILICMVAGCTVQNFSKHGQTFLLKMDRISLPVYIAFFTLIGASIDIDVLIKTWTIGLIIVVARMMMLHIASYLSGKLAGEDPRMYNNYWLGFITQAGVSLGLLSEVARRFPEIGVPVQSILIAVITMNQMIGTIAFKYVLNKLGETKLDISKNLPLPNSSL